MPPPAQPPERSIVLKSTLKPKELGEALRAARAAAGMTQTQIAARLGIPFQNISRLENGAQEAMLSTINKIVRACGWEVVITFRPRKGRGREDEAAATDDDE